MTTDPQQDHRRSDVEPGDDLPDLVAAHIDDLRATNNRQAELIRGLTAERNALLIKLDELRAKAYEVHRCATAVSNLIAQAPSKNSWADWIPAHLKQLAAHLDDKVAP